MSAARHPVSSAQRAEQALRALIFDGELAPGSDHLESELAARLGLSRTPVREAVLLLEQQGLLEVRPRKGVRILQISPEDMREVYDVLTALESMAAEAAAEADHGADGLVRLHAALTQMDAAIARDDRKGWAAADDRFHGELVRLGGNRRVEEIVARMVDQVRRARMVTLYMREMPRQSNADHRAVYEAIRKADPEEAGRLHRRHRARARDELVALLKRLGLKSV